MVEDPLPLWAQGKGALKGYNEHGMAGRFRRSSRLVLALSLILAQGPSPSLAAPFFRGGRAGKAGSQSTGSFRLPPAVKTPLSSPGALDPGAVPASLAASHGPEEPLWVPSQAEVPTDPGRLPILEGLGSRQERIQEVLAASSSQAGPESLSEEAGKILEPVEPARAADSTPDPGSGGDPEAFGPGSWKAGKEDKEDASPRAVKDAAPFRGEALEESGARRLLRLIGRMTGLSAAWTLLRYGAIQGFADQMLDPEQPALTRAEAARELGGLRRLETVEALGQASQDLDPLVRQEARAALARVGEKWTQVLIRELHLHPFSRRRAEAARILGWLARHQADAKVIEALATEGSMDVSHEVRLSAIQALATARSPKALSSLLAMRSLAESPRMRSALEAAVARAVEAQKAAGNNAMALVQPPLGEFENPRQPIHAAALKRVIAVNLLFMAIELVGGLGTGSLSLKADAMHLGADTAVNAGALAAIWLGRRPPNSRKTYGYLKLEALIGLLSSVAISVMAGHMALEAVERLSAPPAVPGLATMLLALAGLAANVISALLLSPYREENLSLRGAFLHAAMDAVGSVGIIASGLLIILFGWVIADPIISFLIVGLILHTTWDKLLKPSWNILLDAVPPGLDLDALEADLLGLPGVVSVADLHVRGLNSSQKDLAASLLVRDRDAQEVLGAAKALLLSKYRIAHSTIQVEVLKANDLPPPRGGE